MSPDVVWDISPGFPHGVVYTGLENVVQDFPIVLQQAADSHVAQQALSG